MINPDKVESRLSSKIFRTLTLYMLIVLCTFFGYVMLFKDVRDTSKPGSGTAVTSPFTALINSLMATETMETDLNFSVAGADLQLQMAGDIKLDIQNQDFSANLNLVYNDSFYTISAYKNSNLQESNTIFVSVNDESYKMDLGASDLDLMEIISNIDFSNLNIDFDLAPIIDALERYTGLDFSDPNLLNNLLAIINDVEPIETETGYLFDIAFNSIRILLGCDSEYNNLSVNVELPTFGEYTVDFSINNAVINDAEFEISDTPNGDEHDLTSILEIINNAKLNENTYALSGDLALIYDDMNLTGNILAMLVETEETMVPYVRFSIEVEGVNSYIYLLDQTIYINLANLNFKFDLSETNINEILDFVETDLGISIDSGMLETMVYVLPALENISINWLENGLNVAINDELTVENVKFYDIVLDVFIKQDEEENILPDSLKLSTKIDFGEGEKLVTVDISNIEIGKNVSEEDLDDIVFNDGMVESVETSTGYVQVSNFIDAVKFIDLAKVLIETENLTGVIDANILTQDLSIAVSGEVKFDIKTMSMSAQISLESEGVVLDFGIYVEDILNLKDIYLTIKDKTLKIDLENESLKKILSQIEMPEVNVVLDTILRELQLDLDLENLDVKEIVLAMLQGMTVTETEEVLTLNIGYQGYSVKVEVPKANYNNYNISISPITLEDISITKLELNNITVNAEGFKITKPTEYVDITSLVEILDNAKLEETEDKTTYAISGDIALSYDDMNLTGNILAMLVETEEGIVPYIRFNTEIEGVKGYVYLLDKTIYVNLANLNFKFDLTEENINEVMAFVESFTESSNNQNTDLDSELETPSEDTVTIIKTILQVLEKVHFAWISENGLDGIQLDYSDNVEMSLSLYLNEIIAKLFVARNDNGDILPSKLELNMTLNEEEREHNVMLAISDIVLGENVKYLEDIDFNENAVANIKTANGMTSLTAFVDAMNLLDIAEVVLNAKGVTGIIDTTISVDDIELSISGDFKFVFDSLTLSMQISIGFDGKDYDIGIYLENIAEIKDIYITIAGKTLKVDLENEKLKDILEMLKSNTSTADTAEMLETVLTKINIDIDTDNFDLYETLKEILTDLTLTETNEKLVLIINYQGYSAEINVYKNAFDVYDVAISPIKIDNITISKLNLFNLTVSSESLVIEKPTEVVDITSLIEILDNAKLEETLDETRYAMSGELSLAYDDMNLTGNIMAMLVETEEGIVPYIRFNTEIEGVKGYVYLLDKTIYVNLANLNFKFDLTEENINEVMAFVERFTSEDSVSQNVNNETTENDIDVEEILQTVLPILKNVYFAWIENGFEITVNDTFNVENVSINTILVQILTKRDVNDNILPDSLKLSTKVDFGEGEKLVTVDISNIEIGKNVSEEDLDDISFNENGEVFEVKVSNNEYEDLSNFIDISDFFGVAKTILDAKNLTFVVDTSLITDSNTINLFGEIKFDIETLSLSANLTVQYDGLLIDFGVYLANINENSQIYITIGGETLKFDLNKIDLNTILQEFGLQAEDDLQNVFDSILNNFQVNLEEIDVKETVIDILQNLSISEDVVDGATQYVVEYKTYSLTFNFDSATNNFFNIQINPLSFDNIQIAKLNIINLIVNDTNFKIEEPKEYSDLSSIFDIVDDAKIKENIYAISGDLAVRYSTTSFYGDILAMLVKSTVVEQNEFGEMVTTTSFTPYVRLHTTSMNLNTYIYLIGNVVYIDLQGLRIKADLTQTTINEIMEFVETEFMADQETSEEIPEESLEEFEFILPALENISVNWLYLEENLAGLQINVDDELYYTASAFFDSIVLQAFGIQDADGTILPTEIVIGANINDANTTVYDNYDEYLLENETLVTASKNFAVYLTNVEIGENANYQEDLVFDENYENVISLTGNENNEGENSYNLEDYLDYSVLLDSFKLVKDYIFGYQYQINIDASLGNNLISGDVNVDVTNAPESDGTNDNFTLFGGKNLAVQGDFDVDLAGTTTKAAQALTIDDTLIIDNVEYDILEVVVGSDVKVSYQQGEGIVTKTYALDEQVEILTLTKHLFSLLYDSDETDTSGNYNENYGGLYMSYSHAEYIDSGDVFRGRIKNLKMSDMISLILGLANIKLDSSTMESWNLHESLTDFSYIHELLGINENDVSDDISQVDSILGDVSAMLQMLNNIDLTKTLDEGTGLYTTSLEILLNIDENVGSVELVLKEENVNGEIVTKLREMKVSNFVVGGEVINLTLTFEDFDNSNFDYFESNPAENHFDLSNLPDFMDTAISTLNTKNFTFNGTVSVNIAAAITLDMNIDLYASIEDINNPYIYAQIEFETSTIASWVFNGDFDTRMVTFEFKDGNLTFHRYSITSELYWFTTWTKIVEDSVSKNTYASDEIMPNLTQIILDSLGIKENISIIGLIDINIPDTIKEIIDTIEVNPSLERTILNFSADETCENMTLSLYGPDLIGDDSAENININLGAKKYDSYIVDDEGNKVDRTFSFIDSITGIKIDMTAVEISFDLYSNNDVTSYNTKQYQLKSDRNDSNGAYVGGKTLYTNLYYRQEYMKTQQVVA